MFDDFFTDFMTSSSVILQKAFLVAVESTSKMRVANPSAIGFVILNADIKDDDTATIIALG